MDSTIKIKLNKIQKFSTSKNSEDIINTGSQNNILNEENEYEKPKLDNELDFD